MKVLVTGGAGFIGSTVADLLIDNGHEVHILDDLSTGFEKNINPAAVFHHLDINSSEAFNVLQKGDFDILCHHAAQMDVRRSVREPVFDAEVNIVGTIRLLEACRTGGVERVVYASTGGAVYGEPETIPVSESHAINPICHYGVSKHTVEHYLFLYRYLYSLDFVILRYPNVYGPRQNPLGEAGVTAIFTLAYLENRPPRINGDGKQLRDYVHAKDVAMANLMAMDLSRTDISGQIFNIGWGKGRSVVELDELIRGYVGTNDKPSYGPELPEEIKRISLNPAKANDLLGWFPKIEFEDGLKDLVDYLRKK